MVALTGEHQQFNPSMRKKYKTNLIIITLMLRMTNVYITVITLNTAECFLNSPSRIDLSLDRNIRIIFRFSYESVT